VREGCRVVLSTRGEEELQQAASEVGEVGDALFITLRGPRIAEKGLFPAIGFRRIEF